MIIKSPRLSLPLKESTYHGRLATYTDARQGKRAGDGSGKASNTRSLIRVTVLVKKHGFEVVTVSGQKELARREGLSSTHYTHVS